eukprot:8406058-Ditylum_brightwellii.AAC.1
MEHSHASKTKGVALLDTKEKQAATAKKKVKYIETNSENHWTASDNNTECSDSSNYGGSNSINSDNSDS